MSYQVLARKWRPQNFHQLVGQEHVKQALVNALNEQRLHHAYLFTGTRGVGKTTIARIFAKSLNCEQGITSTPCGVCSACQDIEAGRFIDLIEIDAASRTKVEDTREILDNVQYAPTRGRYKVYLIDEVHMLSKHSFNALLKTLEEPPTHVKFLLATTDPQKLPVTILSRCLQFNLSALSQSEIIYQLQTVLSAEQLSFDEPSLAVLAKAADGSMRDALSLTDQAIAQTNGQLTVEPVRAMLGLMDNRFAASLLSALLVQDGQLLLGEVTKLSARNPNYKALLDDLLALLHAIQLVQLVPEALAVTAYDEDEVKTFAESSTPTQIQALYQLLLTGKRDLQWAPEPKLGFEMLMLRLLAFEKNGLGQVSAHAVTSQPADEAPAANRAASLRAILDKNKNKTVASEPVAPAHSAPVQVAPMQAAPMQAAPSSPVTQPVVETALTVEPVSQAPVANTAPVHAAQPQSIQTETSRTETSPTELSQPLQASQLFQQTEAMMAYTEENEWDDEEDAMSASQMADYESLMAKAQEQGFGSQPMAPQAPAAADYAPQNQPVEQQPTAEVPAIAAPSAEVTPPAIADVLAQKSAQAQSAIARILQSRQIQGADKLAPKQEPIPAKKSETVASETESKTLPRFKKPDFRERHQIDETKLAPELLAQLSNEKPQQAVVVEQAIPVPENFASPISDIKFAHQQDRWAELIELMGLGGRSRQFALHSIFNQQGKHIELRVDSSQQHLDGTMLRTRMADNLSRVLGHNVELAVTFEPGIMDSPYLIQQKIDAGRLAQAVEVIANDPNVVTFTQEFGAVVDENSIRAL
jgi:DNA polymerase-3 subunit gamma/tau